MSTRSLSAIVALALLAAAPSLPHALATPVEAPGRRADDLQRRPPRVTSLTASFTGADAKVAALSLCLAPDPRLGPSLSLWGDTGSFTLKADPTPCEDGAARYVGSAPLDAAALVARERALAGLAHRLGRPLEVPIFDGRMRTGAKPLPKIDTRLLATGGKVLIDPFWVTPDEVRADRSLLVNAPSVVGDAVRAHHPCSTGGTPLGKWSFGYLMQQIAGPTNASTMTRSWLAHWETSQTVNGLLVAPRTLAGPALIVPWETASGTGNPLDLAKAPFRLLAIVNRIDLAENLAYGSGSGGELRFVFGALAPPPACTPLDFTVIFEFAVPRSGCRSLRDWARAWADLGTLVPGDPAYATALEALTEQIVRAGAAPGHPNGSNLAQIRTNEVALLDQQLRPGTATWEMREFRLDSSGALAQTTLVRTPRPEVNETATLSAWIDANATAIDDGADDYVPDQHPGATPFKGAHALIRANTFWQGPASAPVTSAETRHLFSLNTCNACHGRETDTIFTHVSPRAPIGQEAPLSRFLTGTPPPVVDPVSGNSRTFADLERRQRFLAGVANRSCVFHLFHVPLRMAH